MNEHIVGEVADEIRQYAHKPRLVEPARIEPTLEAEPVAPPPATVLTGISLQVAELGDGHGDGGHRGDGGTGQRTAWAGRVLHQASERLVA